MISLGCECFRTVLERHDGYVRVRMRVYARCYVVFVVEAPGYLLQMLMGGRTESELGVCVWRSAKGARGQRVYKGVWKLVRGIMM